MANQTPGIIRLKPQQFIHVLDNNTGVTRLEVGPKKMTLQDHERLVLEPKAMIIIPPRHYCIIENPVVRDEQGQPISDTYGQIKLAYGETEIRFSQEPFPLYPGEALAEKIQRLQIVETNTALRLRALRDFTITIEGKEIKRLAGDEWLFEGPGTYQPRVDVQVLETIAATIIKPNEALCLRARQNCIDRLGHKRRAGEEWLVREEGAYLPGVDEEVLMVIDAYVLTEKTALHLRAQRTFVDIFGKQRKAGDEWLVTLNEAETHIPDVYEEVIGEIAITTLDDHQWCIVQDPFDSEGKPQLGKSEIRQGCLSFFLHPGESLDGGIREVYVLGEQEALLLKAKERFTEGSGDKTLTHQPGDLWMIEGPTDYIPPIQIQVIEKRKAIPLDKNEGIYVRDMKNGELKLVSGPQAYMLTPYEELWSKELPPLVEDLLEQESDFIVEMRRPPPTHRKAEATVPKRQRDPTRAVVFHVPQNSAVQLHNYKDRTARVVFGPDLVMLGPDEAFTVLSLSGGKPKQPHAIRSLALFMGPDFMTDVFTVETSDHARLQLQLAYNWYFDAPNKNDIEAAARMFQVPDFVGDTCKAIPSRVRGKVAGVKFDEFHRNSAKIIREAVFGTDEQGRVRDEFRFDSNNLVITNVDIRSVEPVDEETLKSLQKSVQIAIKITSDAQEAAARHDAERVEQEAKARLERQGIVDTRQAEAERKKLLELRAENSAIETTGQATAEAKAEAEASRIKGETALNLAQQESEATRLRNQTDLERLTNQQAAELEHQKALTALDIDKSERTATIRTEEFKNRMAAIGPETLKAIATAGPALQADLLKALGLQSVLITDGHSPINLFNTAEGLLGKQINE
jgi:major vault protein